MWVETPSNPLLNIVDIRSAAEAAHAVGAMLVVDNTFATPYLQQPLELGADIVIHSTTKYLGGHSDVVGGFVAHERRCARRAAATSCRSRSAPCPGPFDAWLVLRGIKTLAVRMRQHCENAREIAEFLEGHAAVERVLYPGLPAIPATRSRARRCATSAAWSRSSPRPTRRPSRSSRARSSSQLAESLGGVESLIEHPARMTHASTADAPFAPPWNLVRLSVGIESADDLDRRPRRGARQAPAARA